MSTNNMQVIEGGRHRARRRWLWCVLLLLLVPVYQVCALLSRDEPTLYASAEEHFKYGSIGTEIEAGVPYWIWLVLPRVFPDLLPQRGGYSALGMLWEEGRELPVGFTKQTVTGIPRVGMNCAACHTSSYRLPGEHTKPVIILGGAGQTFDAKGYVNFLFDCAADPRFTADILLPEIERVYPFSWVERQLYRYVVIPRTRKELLKQKAEYAWTNTRPNWGKGRIDFNQVKFYMLDVSQDGSIGTADVMPLWRLKDHSNSFHWDGINPSLREVAIASLLGVGGVPEVINREDVIENLQRVEDFLRELPPPVYPFPINEDLAMKGKSLYEAACASCHGLQGQGTDTIVPVAEVGTDGHRWRMFTGEMASAYKNRTENYPWVLKSFHKTPGYLSVPLTGLWMRAPYLHNGSVPTLRDLLEPPASRPQVFYRGYDVYDQNKVGFLSVEEVTRNNMLQRMFRYDTLAPGNGNGGHLYGVDLPAESKTALLEYLKTL